NDAPTDLNLSANTVAENAANGTVVGTITGVDVDAGDTKAYSLTDNAGGRFAINSATGVITVANSTLLNYEAATSHSVTVRITDRAGATYSETFTINVTNVNEAPAGTNSTVTINEDTTHTLTAANFGFSDVDAGDSFSAVRIDTLPTAGTLRLSGVAVTAGQVISVADVTAGNLVFTPVANANGTGYARFTFSVRDSVNAYDPTPNTLTVNVTAVNDAPVLVVNSGSTVAEGGTDIISSSELAVTDVDDAAAQLTFSVGTGPAHGRLELTTTPGVSAMSFTQADIAANRLLYVHDGSETTGDSFTFTVTDAAGASVGATTVTLTIIPVNDAPTIISDGGGATAAINVAEHVSAVTIVSGIDADLPAQSLSYSVSGGVDQALFTIDATTGALSFVAPSNFSAPADSNGDNVYVVQVRVTDSQGASATQTLHVTVTDVAESKVPTALPPSLVPIAPPVAFAPTPASAPYPLAATGPTVEPIALGTRFVPEEVGLRMAQQPSREVAFRPEEPHQVSASTHREHDEGRLDEKRQPPPTSRPATEMYADDRHERLSSDALSDLLFAKLDRVIEELHKALSVEVEDIPYRTKIEAAAGTALSINFVAWAMRNTALAASLFAMVPHQEKLAGLSMAAPYGGERKRRQHTRFEGEGREAG
ncbi:MAG: cadherin domain-containing protein, partial [Nitrospira sp.]|nr:cadherin domain-containing protein [Nitrospira sp.]